MKNNPEKHAIIEQKKVEFTELKESKEAEIKQMQGDYEKHLEKKEYQRKKEIEDLKNANLLELKAKEEEMNQLMNTLEQNRIEREHSIQNRDDNDNDNNE